MSPAWPWQRLLSRSIISAIDLSTIIPAILHSSALFLIGELNSLGAQGEVRRLGRLVLIGIAGRLRRSWKKLESCPELGHKRLH